MRRWINFARSSFSWLRSRGRPDKVFLEEEALYHAINPDKIDGDGDDRAPNIDAIRFRTNLSVNRAKYSSPRSVLIGEHSKWESWKFLYKDAPPPFPVIRNSPPRRGEIDTYSFKVEHDPQWTSWLDHNYSHSELRAFL